MGQQEDRALTNLIRGWHSFREAILMIRRKFMFEEKRKVILAMERDLSSGIN